jgi:uncharacterized membrane protein
VGPQDQVRIVGMARTTKTRTNAEAAETRGGDDAPNPIWFKPVMFGFMLVGLLWIIVYYVSQTSWPIPALGSWNILIGFGIMFIGFLMTTRWR